MSTTPTRKKTPKEWYDESIAKGLKPSGTYTGSSAEEAVRAGKYIAFYDPTKYRPTPSGFESLDPAIKPGSSSYSPFVEYDGSTATVTPPRRSTTPLPLGDKPVPTMNFGGPNPVKTITNPDGTKKEVSLTSSGPDAKIIEPIVEQYKKGGLIGKVKGYSGGTTPQGVPNNKSYPSDKPADKPLADPDALANIAGKTAEKASNSNDEMETYTNIGVGALEGLGGIGANALMRNAVSENGQTSVGNAAGAGALRGAATTAGLGAKIGTAIAPGVGTLAGAAIGAGVGAGVGATVSGVRAKKENKALQREEELAKLQAAQELQNNSFNRELSEEMQARKTGYGYKKGGLVGMAKGGYVKGPGTGTSDDVNAKVEPGSFIVPAKNAKVAENIDKMMEMKKAYENGGKVIKAPSKKKVATLNEEDGEEVKLSNGEYKFTPEQREEIIKELGEDVLEMLAPEAEDGEEEMANGGLTSAKAKEILRDGTANGKALTDKQKRYFGWIAGGGKPGMYNGGEVEGYAKGGKTKKAPKVQAEVMQQKTVMLPSGQEVELTEADFENSQRMAAYKPELTPDEKKGLSSKQVADIANQSADVASALTNFIFPAKQISMGKKFLAQAGARPKDSMPGELTDAYNRAQQEAKYGFSPQEKAAIDQQSLSLLNRQRDAARLYGGGGANSYAIERQAINESFGRGLQSQIANQERRLQKQMMADQIGMQKAEVSRRLFQDQLNAWQQNQQSGAELVASGLTNAIQAKRYADVLRNLQRAKGLEQVDYSNINIA